MKFCTMVYQVWYDLTLAPSPTSLATTCAASLNPSPSGLLSGPKMCQEHYYL